MPKLLDADHTVLAPDAEAAQPLYARYWLHNRGPAPLGGLPAVAHLHPQRLAPSRILDCCCGLPRPAIAPTPHCTARVRLICPDGWTATPDGLPFVLPPGEHLRGRDRTGRAVRTPAGLYPVRAELAVTGSDANSMPAAWRQVVEDVVHRRRRRVRTTPPCCALVSEPEHVDVTAGRSARLAVTVGTDARAELAVEAHLISPWGTWEWIGPAALGAIAAGRRHGGARIRRGAAGLGRARPSGGRWFGSVARAGCLLTGGEGHGPMSAIAATVGRLCRSASTRSTRREAALRAGPVGGHACPARAPARAASCVAGSPSCWSTERVVAVEAAARGVTGDGAPAEDELLPDASTRLEIGSITAAALADPRAARCSRTSPPTSTVTDDDVADYQAPQPGALRPRRAVANHLHAAARRRAFRRVAGRSAAPRWSNSHPATNIPATRDQPDNTHRH